MMKATAQQRHHPVLVCRSVDTAHNWQCCKGSEHSHSTNWQLTEKRVCACFKSPFASWRRPKLYPSVSSLTSPAFACTIIRAVGCGTWYKPAVASTPHSEPEDLPAVAQIVLAPPLPDMQTPYEGILDSILLLIGVPSAPDQCHLTLKAHIGTVGIVSGLLYLWGLT